MKRYCKVTLNKFFKDKVFNEDKKSYLYNRFFVLNQNLTTKHIKIV